MEQLKRTIVILNVLFFSITLGSCSKTTAVENHLLIIAQQDSLYGIWDIRANNWLVPNKYQNINYFKEGFAAFEKAGKWGFVDTTGKEVLPAVYDDVYAEGFIGGNVFVNTNGKWGMIDKNGKEVLAAQFDNVYLYEEGYYEVLRGEDANLVSEDGKIFLPNWYTSVNHFHKGYASAQTKLSADDAVDCIIDKKGRVNWSDSLLYNIFPFGGGTSIATARKDNRKVMIDTTGKILFTAPHDWIKLSKIENYESGYVTVSTTINNGSRYGLLNPSGRLVLDTVYDELGGMNEGVVSFRMNDKWGIADSAGKIIVAPAFDHVGDFHNGLAVAFIKDKCGFIDRTGNWIIPAQFDDAYNFEKDMAFASIGKNAGLIDKTGKWIIPCKYEQLSHVVNNDCFLFMKNGKYGIVNNKGEELCSAKFDHFSTSVMKIKNGTMSY